jgi:hypothetical protein
LLAVPAAVEQVETKMVVVHKMVEPIPVVVVVLTEILVLVLQLEVAAPV